MFGHTSTSIGGRSPRKTDRVSYNLNTLCRKKTNKKQKKLNSRKRRAEEVIPNIKKPGFNPITDLPFGGEGI